MSFILGEIKLNWVQILVLSKYVKLICKRRNFSDIRDNADCGVPLACRSTQVTENTWYCRSTNWAIHPLYSTSAELQCTTQLHLHHSEFANPTCKGNAVPTGSKIHLTQRKTFAIRSSVSLRRPAFNSRINQDQAGGFERNFTKSLLQFHFGWCLFTHSRT